MTGERRFDVETRKREVYRLGLNFLSEVTEDVS